MSILIAGILVIASFLLGSALMFSTFLTTSLTQGDSLRELTRLSRDRLGSAISISSAAASDVSGGTDMTVQVGNSGSRSVVSLSEMDVIVDYTDPDDNQVVSYLAYTTLALGDNQWTLSGTGITPDTFNPNIWDPDETVFLDLRVVPQVKAGTTALVVVSTPQGVGDQTSVNN